MSSDTGLWCHVSVGAGNRSGDGRGEILTHTRPLPCLSSLNTSLTGSVESEFTGSMSEFTGNVESEFAATVES